VSLALRLFSSMTLLLSMDMDLPSG